MRSGHAERYTSLFKAGTIEYDGRAQDRRGKGAQGLR